MAASAATYYRNKYIPAGVCMVSFGEHTINAVMIQEMEAGTLQFYEKLGASGWLIKTDDYGYRSYPAFRVKLVNGNSYWKKTETVAEAEMLKVGFQKTIKTECGT